MSVPITIKIRDDVFKALSRNLAKHKGKASRSAYINEAILRAVKADERRELAAAILKASTVDRDDPILRDDIREWQKAGVRDFELNYPESEEHFGPDLLRDKP